MSQITAFGKEIKHRLIDVGRPQTWLIEEVRQKTGMFFDSSYLHKIQSGKLHSPKMVAAICDVLGLEEE